MRCEIGQEVQFPQTPGLATANISPIIKPQVVALKMDEGFTALRRRTHRLVHLLAGCWISN